MKKILAFSLFLLSVLTACSSLNSETQLNADAILDEKLYSEAVQSNSLDLCSQIQDGREKDCKIVVASNLITDEAVKKLDMKMCDQIENERYKEFCVSKVKAQKADRQKLEEESKFIKNQNKLMNELISQGSVEECGKIEDLNYRENCKNNILTNKAISEKDQKYCDQIKDESLAELCRSNF